MTSACAIQHMRADESRASGDGATPKMGACFGKRERECWIVCGDTKQKTKDSRQRTAALRANSLSLEHTKARLVSDGPPDTGISRSSAENLRIKRLQYIKPYASHPHTQKKTTPKPQIRNRKQLSSLDIKAYDLPGNACAWIFVLGSDHTHAPAVVLPFEEDVSVEQG